ncbi:MAG: PP-loop domain protein [Acidobacteria bacterium]|nr:PP-loop domain protein [Acidobacteriota bacterium]
MNPLADATLAFLDEHQLGRPRILAAVSGGADSVALLVTLCELGIDVVAAHVNHHLRGSESDDDEQFVRELCASLNVELLIADGTLSPELIRQHGIEGAAREVRYERLHELRGRCGAGYIATAHQQNDQAETVLMRRMSGSGLAGKRGIHPLRDDGVIRPLLDVPRCEIEQFLRERHITPRHDSSNDDTRFLRNVVRGIVGTMENFDRDAVAALADSTKEARAAWAEAERKLDAVDDTERAPGATVFRSLPDDRTLREALIVRHIRRLEPAARDLTAVDVARIVDGLERVRRMSVTKHLELVRRGGVVVLRRRLEPARAFEVPLAPGAPARIEAIDALVHVRAVDDDDVGSRERQRIQLPPDAAPTFVVRNRRAGDRFQPLGLPHDKKLKDFLIDRKIAAETRDHIPLILWNDIVASVAGVEISEQFRITSAAGQRYEVWVEHEHH